VRSIRALGAMVQRIEGTRREQRQRQTRLSHLRGQGMACTALAMASGEKELTGVHGNGPSGHQSEQEMYKEKEELEPISPWMKMEAELRRRRRSTVSGGRRSSTGFR
jgi:hypothetical protein